MRQMLRQEKHGQTIIKGVPKLIFFMWQAFRIMRLFALDFLIIYLWIQGQSDIAGNSHILYRKVYGVH